MENGATLNMKGRICMDDIFRKEFKTDGELYDTALTRDTEEEAIQLYKEILRMLDKYAAISILDIICLITRFPAPSNWSYAHSNGYYLEDAEHFAVRPTDDGKKWRVYLGNPRKLW